MYSRSGDSYSRGVRIKSSEQQQNDGTDRADFIMDHRHHEYDIHTHDVCVYKSSLCSDPAFIFEEKRSHL